MTRALPDFEGLASGDKSAVTAALSAIERQADSADVQALLDRAWGEPKGHVVGMTGPPGVGKSTLLGALVEDRRAVGETVGVIAVDPSSRRTGGALLGDRIRVRSRAGDDGVFIRSMAARDRLGGLAALTYPAMVLMRAVYDLVLIETVGVGQSETDVADVVDTVTFCVQPGSGDSLQFMKAGIMEIPHIAVVTKADLGEAAARAAADVTSALHLASGSADDWPVSVLQVSASKGEGIADLAAKITEHAAWLEARGARAQTRHQQAQAWLLRAVRERFGSHGADQVDDLLSISQGASPFAAEREISAKRL